MNFYLSKNLARPSLLSEQTQAWLLKKVEPFPESSWTYRYWFDWNQVWKEAVNQSEVWKHMTPICSLHSASETIFRANKKGNWTRKTTFMSLPFLCSTFKFVFCFVQWPNASITPTFVDWQSLSRSTTSALRMCIGVFTLIFCTLVRPQIGPHVHLNQFWRGQLLAWGTYVDRDLRDLNLTFFAPLIQTYSNHSSRFTHLDTWSILIDAW